MSFKPSYDKLAKTWNACSYLETQLTALELPKCHMRHYMACHDYEHGTRRDIFPWLFGLQVSRQNTLAKSYSSWFDFGVLSSPSCHLNSDSVTEHRCNWTSTEVGISEEKGNCMKKLWIKEKIRASTPRGFLLSLQTYQETHSAPFAASLLISCLHSYNLIVLPCF